MGTPKGTRCRRIALAADGCVHVYSNDDQLILQLRRTVPTEDGILSPSFKIAVPLRPTEALELASEILAVASAHVDRLRMGDAELIANKNLKDAYSPS